MTGEVTRHPFDWGDQSPIWAGAPRRFGGASAGGRPGSSRRARALGVTRHRSGSCTARVSSATFVLFLASREGGNGAYGRLLLLLIAEIKAGSYGASRRSLRRCRQAQGLCSVGQDAIIWQAAADSDASPLHTR